MSVSASTSTVTPPPASLFKNYIETIYESQDFAAHHRLHGDDAFLLVGPRVDRKRDLPVADYAAFMSDTLKQLKWTGAALRDRAPCFRAPRLRGAVPGIDGETVALVEVTEAHSGTAFTAAFGTGTQHGRAVVRWVSIVTDEPAGINPAHLRAQAAAELSFVPPFVSRDTLLLSLLEVAYYRRHMLPDVPMSWLPEAQFSCHMSARCCHGWTINLTPNDLGTIQSLGYPARAPTPLYGLRPSRSRADEHLSHAMTLRPDGACPLLTADRLCQVHADTGMAAFSTCHTYPFGFSYTPDGVAVWTSSFCPSARGRKGAPLSEREPDLRQRLQRIARHAAPTEFRLSPGRPISWERFRQIEAALLDALDPQVRPETPVRLRLAAGLRWLASLPPDAPPPPLELARLVQPLAPPPPEQRALWQQILALASSNRAFQPLLPGSPDAAARPRDVPGAADHELGALPFVPYFLRTLVFSKTLSFHHGVVAGWNFVTLAYCLFVERFRRVRPELLNDDLLAPFFLGIQHEPLRALLERMGPALGGIEHTPELGLWLLQAMAFADAPV